MGRGEEGEEREGRKNYIECHYYSLSMDIDNHRRRIKLRC